MLKTVREAAKLLMFMFAATLTVLNIRCTSVVYVNSPSQSLKHKVPMSSVWLKTVKWVVHINY
jgi:hypothetical protein